MPAGKGNRRGVGVLVAGLLAVVLTLPLVARISHAQGGGVAEVVRTWGLPGGRAPVRIVTADGRWFVLTRAPLGNLVVVDALSAASSEAQTASLPRRPTDLALLRTATFDPTTSLHAVEEYLCVTTTRDDAEIAVVRVAPGSTPVVDRTLDLSGNADALAIAIADGVLVVGRKRSAASPEFLVLDTTGTVVGALELPQSIEAIEVSAGVARASSRRWTFAVDVSDPALPVLIGTEPRPGPPDPPVIVARTIDFATDGPLAYLAARQRGREIQQVNLRTPLAFPDADGDGVWRLGCLGDSNTAPVASLERWCERLVDLVDDPRFTVDNLAVAGATAIPSANSAATQVAGAIDPALRLDAAAIAFGTNDTNLVHFSTDPDLFDSQVANIVGHLAAHVATLEAHGLTVYVATVPPRFKALFGPDGFNERVVAVNDGIRSTFAASSLIEHYDYFHADPSEIADGVHLNQRGQDKRAWRAFRALTR